MSEHGTRARYNGGCRCDKCREANRAYNESLRRAAGVRPIGPRLGCGTRAAYARGCRCQGCREANRVHQRAAYRRRVAVTRASGLPPTVQHGCSAYRNWGCRCDVCRTESVAVGNAWNERRSA